MTPRRCGWSPGPLLIWRDLAPNAVSPDPSRGLIPTSLQKSPPSSLCQAASPGSCSPDPTWDSPAWRHPISGTQNTLQRVREMGGPKPTSQSGDLVSWSRGHRGTPRPQTRPQQTGCRLVVRQAHPPDRDWPSRLSQASPVPRPSSYGWEWLL